MPTMNPIIRHPAKFVPLIGVALGNAGEEAVAVSKTKPFPCSDQPFTAIRALVPDAPVEPGLAILVDCTTAGKIVLGMSDDSQLPLTFSPGVTLLPLAVRRTISIGTTANFNAWVLD